MTGEEFIKRGQEASEREIYDRFPDASNVAVDAILCFRSNLMRQAWASGGYDSKDDLEKILEIVNKPDAEAIADKLDEFATISNQATIETCKQMFGAGI
jgi:hypothetical protein